MSVAGSADALSNKSLRWRREYNSNQTRVSFLGALHLVVVPFTIILPVLSHSDGLKNLLPFKNFPPLAVSQFKISNDILMVTSRSDCDLPPGPPLASSPSRPWMRPPHFRQALRAPASCQDIVFRLRMSKKHMFPARRSFPGATWNTMHNSQRWIMMGIAESEFK